MDSQNILSLIPQRPPFVMVSSLESVGENFAISEFFISKDCVLLENDLLQESGMIENMAQTAAMFAGYQAKENGINPPIGFIASVKNLRIFSKPESETSVKTKIELKSEVMNMQIAQAEVRNNKDELLAECELRIYLKEDG